MVYEGEKSKKRDDTEDARPQIAYEQRFACTVIPPVLCRSLYTANFCIPGKSFGRAR